MRFERVDLHEPRFGFIFHVVAVAGSFLSFVRQLVDLVRSEVAALVEDVDAGGAHAGALLGLLGWLGGFVFAAVEVGDFLADSHAAPVVAAHGAEIGVDFQIFIVIGAGEIGIERQIEMLLPVQRGSRLGQLVVAIARAGDAQGDVPTFNTRSR
jgi:hypothetical protein